MKTPSPKDILSVDTDSVADFIQHHAAARTLTPMVKRLNDSLMCDEPTARQLAAQALHHLGFVEYA